MSYSLNGQSIVLGITGSVAIYKSCELIRLLRKSGVKVHVVMTKSASELIKPMLFQALSGEHVYTDMWQYNENITMPHINLTRMSSAIIVAPATANFMSKVANGVADDLLSTVCLSRNIPLLIAPAMNVEMWNNTATQRNYKTLLKDEVVILEPKSGSQACGESGFGRMQEPEEIVAFLNHKFTRSKTSYLGKTSLENSTVLITAGPTYEAIDPIRGITNKSSGKLGYAIAEIAKSAGAKVILVSGPVAINSLPSVKVENVDSADQMLNKVRKIIKEEKVDFFFSVAAVSDWKPKVYSKNKIKKSTNNSLNSIEWEQTKDILYEISNIKNKKRPFVVGFVAETVSENLLIKACQKKMKDKGVDMIVGTNGPNTFGKDEARMVICFPNIPKISIKGSKKQIAKKLFQLIEKNGPQIQNVYENKSKNIR